ncbi:MULTISPECIES: cisplatin damage response ATP-dependent DNA ligase [Sphingomonas]|uniref:cisplatin damage response ATP-dependent DNA ligase n=1 Tax=Sphingomonas TaxID=13687 RepID=UPI00255113A4|nr:MULTISPECIES: cisplatin damage response ATP-dependent DNA ligase [Sphingomonas]MDK8186988.1 cisplatin damage response ATP-dependent DNA ligase [Sphingomonas zeae]MDK8216804.1 cisplatin damage response ATP-dependent DNA ligase [Sphingomonas sp. UMB7805-LC452B]
MRAFAELLDRLSFEPARNAKLRLIETYLAATPDPERGYALGALTGSLRFRHATPKMVRVLVRERVEPLFFNLSHEFVGDLSETVALLWPEPAERGAAPTLTDVVTTLGQTSRTAFPDHLARWLDALDPVGRWALLKLITGALRIGVSARLAKTALARLGDREVDDVEAIWHGLEPPFTELFAWIEGKGPALSSVNPAPFRPPMLAHGILDRDMATLDAGDYAAEWKWDGIRVNAVSGQCGNEPCLARLYSRTGEDISAAFPDLMKSVGADRFGPATLDGELLVVRDGVVEPFGTLQQRLNRKTVSAKMVAEYPIELRAYDLLAEGGEDLRALPFATRRARLEAFVARVGDPRITLSPLVAFDDWEHLARIRADPAAAGAGIDAPAIEGLMLKRRDAPYVSGRPRGPWFKWKRDPFNVDAVMMYAQRGSGKRSSLYSDFTFGVWHPGPDGEALIAVGKSYFGFTDDELALLDRYVREHTASKFGPVREVVHGADGGLVLEIAFEGLNRSKRHKSGVAMRFPRISRIRWDKPAIEADRLETLTAMLPPLATARKDAS